MIPVPMHTSSLKSVKKNLPKKYNIMLFLLFVSVFVSIQTILSVHSKEYIRIQLRS